MFSMQVSIAFANHVFLLEEISFYDGIFEKKIPRVASAASDFSADIVILLAPKV